MPLFRCLHRQKKLLIICAICCVFACRLPWKYDDRIEKKPVCSTNELLMCFWNDSQLLTRTGSTVDNAIEDSTKAELLIAIGGGITSKKLYNVSDYNIGEKFQFLHTLLPTFCNTSSAHYIYTFYLAYDRDDKVFANERLRDAFQRQFHSTTTSGVCRDRGVTTNLSLVQCNYSGKPTWAQNDAMLEAYLDHVDYFYRVNDDTRMLTGGWTELFIATLESYDPPRVGVVGPRHSGGNVRILTYDFVHRTHVDIFGFYYPRLFTDWWGDRWITGVYKPNRSTKVSEVRLAHTRGLGQRYGAKGTAIRHLDDQLANDISVINR